MDTFYFRHVALNYQNLGIRYVILYSLANTFVRVTILMRNQLGSVELARLSIRRNF